MARVEMIETDCTCGLPFALPKRLYNSVYKDGGTFYCPAGHALSWEETETDRQRRRADKLAQQVAQRDDEITNLENQKRAAKGQITKLKKRASAGVCPCCHRTFQNVASHMQNRHPEFVKEQGTKVVRLRAAK